MSTKQTHKQITARFNSTPSLDLMNDIGEKLSELQSLAARYSDQVQQAAQTFSARLKSLEDAIGLQSGLPHSVTIDAIHPAADNGFYDIEYEESGWPFRWSGPSRDFSFDLKIDRSAPLRLRIHLIAMIDFKQQSDLLLLVNGVSVQIRLAEHEEGGVGSNIRGGNSRRRRCACDTSCRRGASRIAAEQFGRRAPARSCFPRASNSPC